MNGYWKRTDTDAQIRDFYVSCMAVDGAHTPAKSQREIWSFGYNLYGDLARPENVQTTSPVSQPVVIPVLSDMNSSKLSLGCNHGAAVTRSGGVYLWGSNVNGQIASDKGIGVPLANQVALVLPKEKIGGKLAVDVASGADFTLVLTQDGEVWGFGSNV
jgi:alpha-tubulin suppressor-like RCC1 family protein